MNIATSRTYGSETFNRSGNLPIPVNPSQSVTEISASQSVATAAAPIPAFALEDTFVQNATVEQTQERLSPVFNTLRNYSELGANASEFQILENFRSTVIPEAITQLNQRIIELEQAEQTPQQQLELDNARASLALYQQAETVLAQSPLFTSSALSPDTLSGIVQTALIPEQTKDSYSSAPYDKYIRTPRSADTFFNQRKNAIDEQISVLATAAETASPEESAKYQRIQALMQELSDLYGSFPDYVKTGNDFIEDVASLNQRIASVSQALNAASADLGEADIAAIDAQLQDLMTLGTELAAMPNRPGNLGYSINFTYKRVGEIQAGKRTRETPDISGALASYVNDRKDMVVFVSRFGDLRAGIRSGSLSGQAAIDKALAAIPGTSQAFKTVFTQLIQAELELAEAANLRRSARADVAEGNRQAAQGEQNVSAAQDSNRASRQAGQQARGAADQNDFGGARTLNGRAVVRQQEGASRAGLAQQNVEAADVSRRRAASKETSATRLTSSADRRVDQSALSAFAPDLQEPIQGARQEVDRSRAEGVSLNRDIGALGARTERLSESVAVVVAENVEIQQSNIAGERYIDETELTYQQQQQEQENEQRMTLLESVMLTGGAYRKFEETFLVKLGAGSKLADSGASVTGQLKVGVSGEVKADGSVALDVAIDVGVSAELNVFIADIKGAVEFGGSYGLRFSRENAVEFTRLLNGLVNTLGNEGISPRAEQARERLFAFMQANARTEGRVTVSASGSVGSGNEKSGLGAKVQVSRIVQNSSVDSNGNQRFDSDDRVTRSTSYQAALTVDVTVDGHKYSGKFVGAYDADTGRIKRPTLTVESLGRQIPDRVLASFEAQGQAQGVLAEGQTIPRRALTEARNGVSQPSSIVGKPVSRIAVDFEAGNLTYTQGTRRDHDTDINIGANKGKLSGYDETGTSIKVTL